MKRKSQYLKLMKKHQIEPNFFISETYFERKDLVGKGNRDFVWIEQDDEILFPVLPFVFSDEKSDYYPAGNIWASFPNMVCSSDSDYTKKFLDYQYLYRPNDFLDLSGKKWETFRKNSRKWPKQNKVHTYMSIRNLSAHTLSYMVKPLLLDWLTGEKQEIIQDAEFIANTLLYPNNRAERDDYYKILVNDNDEVVGLNYADENYKYINYRFLICKKEPFLDEYLRFLFYTDIEIRLKNKWVNDGGVLDSEGLERFKDKLNPVRKDKIYSWLIK